MCSSAFEIIILLRSSAVQAAKEIYDIITQTKDNQALYLAHREFQKDPLVKNEKKKNKKQSVMGVHGNSAVDVDLQPFSSLPRLLLHKIALICH